MLYKAHIYKASIPKLKQVTEANLFGLKKKCTNLFKFNKIHT